MGGVVPLVVQAGCSPHPSRRHPVMVPRCRSFPQPQRESLVLGLPASCTDFWINPAFCQMLTGARRGADSTQLVLLEPCLLRAGEGSGVSHGVPGVPATVSSTKISAGRYPCSLCTVRAGCEGNQAPITNHFVYLKPLWA